jgi:hypothetical protein
VKKDVETDLATSVASLQASLRGAAAQCTDDYVCGYPVCRAAASCRATTSAAVAAVSVRRDGSACAKWPNDNPAVCVDAVAGGHYRMFATYRVGLVAVRWVR